MKILVAKNAGFCFGVRRAVDLALQSGALGKPTYTLGELIHNPLVIEELKSKGIFPVDEQGLKDIKEGSSVIIRSHGVAPEIYDVLKTLKINIVDATCPYVKKIHDIVYNACKNDEEVFIVGEPRHPEVLGIFGWANKKAKVIKDEKDAKTAEFSSSKTHIVCQTTYSEDDYNKICAILKQKKNDIYIHNTICGTTQERQMEAVELAKKSTLIVVAGGRNSSNTQKLASICKKYCERIVYIENPDQLLLEKILPNDIIGIVAGASTPQRMIREVITVMNELEKATVETTETPADNASDTIGETAISNNEEENCCTNPDADSESSVEATQESPVTATDADEPEQKSDSTDMGDSFAEAFEKTMVRIRSGQVIKGSVVQIADGEVCVNIGYKSDGFIPKNEFSSDPDVNPTDIVKVGDEIEVEVLKVNDGEGNVLLSRKNVEGKLLWDELMAEANTPDKIFEAVGKEVVKGGLIALIGGVRAFIPASHVSTKYVENLQDYIGQPLKLSVIEIDKSRKRIVASQKNVLLKELEEIKKERWNQLEVGSKLNGVVRRITDFGAFVDIGGIDGLVHVTDVAWGRVKHPSDILKIGQEIEVLILNVDIDKERVSLGYKQLQPKPWAMAGEKYTIGSVVEGKVVRIVPFGAFVSLEPTIDGLIHISQVGVRRIAKVEDEINVGDMVRCKVLEVNPEAKRISLSRKEVILEENPDIAEQIAAERAERDRQFAEKQEQRIAERKERTSAKTTASGSSAATSASSGEKQKPAFESRPERSERRPRRNNEDGDYELPPVQTTTTSLASLFEGLKLEDTVDEAEEAENVKETKPKAAPKKKAKAAEKPVTDVDEPAKEEAEPKEKKPRKTAAKKKATKEDGQENDKTIENEEPKE